MMWVEQFEVENRMSILVVLLVVMKEQVNFYLQVKVLDF